MFPPPEEPTKVEENKIAIVTSFLSQDSQDGCKESGYKKRNENTENSRLTEDNQFITVLEHNGIKENNTNIDFEKEITIENINPMEVFRSLENKDYDKVRHLNKCLQKHKLADENKIFRFILYKYEYRGWHKKILIWYLLP